MAPRPSRSFPLSFAQRSLWVIEQLAPGTPIYNLPWSVYVYGPPRIGALREAFREIVRRHESLRTVFRVENEEPVQFVLEELPIELPLVDLEPLASARREELAAALYREEAARPFNLTKGPLLRILLLRLDARRSLLVLNLHHIISDGWSIGLLLSELETLYSTFREGRPSPLPELPVQYVDFAVWQLEQLQGPRLERELAYWRNRLAGLPPLLWWRTDRPRPPVESHRGAVHGLKLTSETTAGLRRLAAEGGTTLFVVLLSAFQVLLFRSTLQTDIAVGSPVANRGQDEIEGLIGFFVNTLVIRTDLSGNLEFSDLIERVRDRVLEALEHQDLPFEKVVEELLPERDLSHAPIFQSMFGLQNQAKPFALAGLEVEGFESGYTPAKFDLSLLLAEEADEVAGVFEYARDLFDASTVQRMTGHFLEILQAATAAPPLRTDELPFLGEGEKAQILASCVRVRGYLLDPAEIEACLLKAPGVTEATVLVREAVGGDERLAAYLCSAGEPLDTDALRSFLRHRLPEFMVPTALTVVDEMPRGPEGKIDLDRLPEPLWPTSVTRDYVPPRNQLETYLARVWAELLDLDRVGVEHNFFELGGQSLLAMQLISRVRADLKIDLPLRRIFRAPTIAGVAAAVVELAETQLENDDADERRDARGAEAPVLKGFRTTGGRPALFCVPPADGHVHHYEELAKRLGDDQPFYAIELPDKPAFSSLVDAASAYLEAIRQNGALTGPVRLSGWSLGGVVAFEMARQLAAEGEEALLFLLDPTPPGKPRAVHDELEILTVFAHHLSAQSGRDWPTSFDELRELSSEERFRFLFFEARMHKVIPSDIDADQLKDLFAAFRAGLTWHRSYSAEVFGGHGHLFLPIEGGEERLGSWNELFAGGLTVHEVPGDHFSFLRPPHVEALARALSTALRVPVSN